MAWHFNSRPCERGDLCSRRAWLRTSNFNSRPCERGDAKTLKSSESLPISIHAPARGATWRRSLKLAAQVHFNSRPCERGDGFSGFLAAKIDNFNSRPCERGDCLLLGGCCGSSFQFTPLREGRPAVPRGRSLVDYFNSRPCERGDARAACTGCPGRISIHAPARGATGP